MQYEDVYCIVLNFAVFNYSVKFENLFGST